MGKKHREGFTLIELLVLMMVLAVALGLGVPAFNAMMANNRMSAAANDVVSSLHAARNEALTRSRSVTLCASSNTAAERPACDPGTTLLGGWIVFVDANANATVDEGEAVLQARGPLDDGILGQAQSKADRDPPHYVSFRAEGFPQAYRRCRPASATSSSATRAATPTPATVVPPAAGSRCPLRGVRISSTWSRSCRATTIPSVAADDADTPTCRLHPRRGAGRARRDGRRTARHCRTLCRTAARGTHRRWGRFFHLDPAKSDGNRYLVVCGIYNSADDGVKDAHWLEFKTRDELIDAALEEYYCVTDRNFSGDDYSPVITKMFKYESQFEQID